MDYDSDVLIVGGGLVGASLALALVVPLIMIAVGAHALVTEGIQTGHMRLHARKMDGGRA